MRTQYLLQIHPTDRDLSLNLLMGLRVSMNNPPFLSDLNGNIAGFCRLICFPNVYKYYTVKDFSK